MKAVEFVKQNGWEEAQFLLDEWDGVTTNWSLDTGFLYVDQSIDTHMLCMESLKQLIEAKELVEFIGNDLSGAKQVYEFTKKAVNIAISDRVVPVESLKKAIQLVESC